MLLVKKTEPPQGVESVLSERPEWHCDARSAAARTAWGTYLCSVLWPLAVCWSGVEASSEVAPLPPHLLGDLERRMACPPVWIYDRWVVRSSLRTLALPPYCLVVDLERGGDTIIL